MDSPQHFQGAVLVETGKDVQIMADIRIPALRRGQVLVKMLYAGLCHSQLMEVRGLRGPDAYLPHFLGHEGVGIAIDIGEGVRKVKPQDRVILGWIKGEGIDAGGTVYETHSGLKINSGAVTTFSQYAVVSENRLVPKPPHTPDDLAVLYGCALPTGAGLVFNEIKPARGSTIVVIGLGGIGLSALLACRHFEPFVLIAIDLQDDKLAMAREIGATHTLRADDSALRESVIKLTNGGADYAIEAAGLTRTIELGFDLIRRGGGSLTFASHPAAGEKISLDPFELICGKSIRGTWGGGSKPDRDIPLLDKMYGEGKLPLAPLLSHRYGLHEINQALADLQQRKIVRALIAIHPEAR